MSSQLWLVVALCLTPFVLFGMIELINHYLRHRHDAIAKRDKARELTRKRSR